MFSMLVIIGHGYECIHLIAVYRNAENISNFHSSENRYLMKHVKFDKNLLTSGASVKTK